VIGRTINNYEIKTVIAEGGMGTVYLAAHSFMGRKVVKVLRRAYAEDDAMVLRFMNEARAANAIQLLFGARRRGVPPSRLAVASGGGPIPAARSSEETRAPALPSSSPLLPPAGNKVTAWGGRPRDARVGAERSPAGRLPRAARHGIGKW
jgi:hypothetical protein